MSIFKKLFGSETSKQEEPSARIIVHDFATVAGQLNLPILDAKLLPHPKNVIQRSFDIHIAQLEVAAKHSPAVHSELQKVRSVSMLLSDFQEIDPEDRDMVSEINAGRRFEKFRSRAGLASGFANKQEEEDFIIFSDLQNKYFLRSSQEQGIV